MTNFMRKIIFGLSLALLLTLAVVCGCNCAVVCSTSDCVHDSVDAIEHETWGMLLGTTPQTRFSGKRNYFFKYRIDAAVQLYKAGKIDSLLISGDDASLGGVNEPVAMRDTLVKYGIPASVILLDGKGYRTQASIINTCNVYGIKSFVVISQRFHNERAVFLARHMRSVEIDRVQAFNAQSPWGNFSFITYLREYLARVKVFVDLAMDGADCNFRK